MLYLCNKIKFEEMLISETVKNGVVVKVSGKKARVKVSCDEGSCNGCRISSICHTPTYTPTLRATITRGLEVKEGDHVIITGRLKDWFKSWLLMAGMPCIAIMAGLVIGSILGMKDGATGGLALGFVLCYYIILWVFRARVDRKVEWSIESVITE